MRACGSPSRWASKLSAMRDLPMPGSPASSTTRPYQPSPESSAAATDRFPPGGQQAGTVLHAVPQSGSLRQLRAHLPGLHWVGQTLQGDQTEIRQSNRPPICRRVIASITTRLGSASPAAVRPGSGSRRSPSVAVLLLSRSVRPRPRDRWRCRCEPAGFLLDGT